MVWEDRVKEAKALVLLQVNSELVGITAIKQPLRTYRDGVFKKAGVPEAAEVFQLELGWVYAYPRVLGHSFENETPYAEQWHLGVERRLLAGDGDRAHLRGQRPQASGLLLQPE
ncbi:MAG: hypothetical protein ABIX28_18755 [Vicinamibacterales bacterium]